VESCFQTGIAADNITAITPIATNKATMAYPRPEKYNTRRFLS
jgi:hypothetical protein